MIGPELPDDPRDWPDDPFAILGVPRGADDKDVKRAYTRLIRRFKPEHFPEQFRLVREAYEACLARSHWYRREPEPDDEPAALPESIARPLDEVGPDRPVESLRRPGAERDSPESPPRPEPRIDPIDQLWKLASTGREAEAYTGLVEQARFLTDRADLSLRLYWLLALDPALDGDRTRHEWLAEALTRSRLRGPAVELYRRELEADHSALGGPYANLLATTADHRDLLTVARFRVAAAGRSGASSRIEADLDDLRPRVAGFDDEAWLGLLVTAKDWTAWTPRGEADAFVRRELAHVRHLELSHAFYFDRMEESGRIALEMRWANVMFPRPLATVIWAAFAAHGDVYPDAVTAAAAAVTADAERLLSTFAWAVREHGPVLLFLAVEALERHFRVHVGPGEPEFPPELIRGLVRRALPGRDKFNYEVVQLRLLHFLLREAIDPRELADACEQDPDERFRLLAKDVQGDPGLRVVWLAQRIHPADD
jgi:hypothetical protein